MAGSNSSDGELIGCGMKKRRVLLLCSKDLHGESLENLLRDLEDVEVIGPWILDKKVISSVADDKPDVILIAAGENQSETVSDITGQILDKYPNLTVIHSTLARNIVRVYSSRELPARKSDLIEAIRK